MNTMSPFCEFEFSNIVIFNYQHPPMNEYLAQLEKMRLYCGNELRLSTYKIFKGILNFLLTGRAISDEHLKLTLEYCKKSRNDKEFLEIARCLYKLVKDYININSIISLTIDKLIESANENIFLLCNDEEHWNHIKLNITSENHIIPVTKKELNKNYINGTLVIICPCYWLGDFLSYPTAKDTYIIQPSVMPPPNINRDIYKDFNGFDISIGIESNVNIDFVDVYIPYDIKYESIFRTIEEKELKDDNLIDLIGNHSHVYSYDLLGNNGVLNIIQANKSYITVNNMGFVSNKIINDASDINNVKYIVTNIDHSKLSHEDVNRELQKQMEKWKLPLRNYSRQHELSKKLSQLGALKASHQNIKNWSSSTTIAPKNTEDYLAVLAFAGIVDEEEISFFFRLARNIRGSSISIGHHKADIAREIIKNEIVKQIEAGESLPHMLSVGNVEAEVLFLEGTMYG